MHNVDKCLMQRWLLRERKDNEIASDLWAQTKFLWGKVVPQSL